MKFHFFILALLISFGIVSAVTAAPDPDSTITSLCIDPALINPNAYCIMIYDPVCGCDGVTYGNSCLAGNNGVTSFVRGECNGNGWNCVDPSLINHNAICPDFWMPVCGCDGVTYSNDCDATAAGITSFYPGECGSIGMDCIDSTLIDPTLGCPMYYLPVCGCNGITYGNECDAMINGVTSYFYGECGSVPGCMASPYFYYSFDADGKTVYFMNFSLFTEPNGNINNTPGGVPSGITALWDFGDGTTSTDLNPAHTYADSASGVYTVCLTVTDTIENCTETYCELLYDYTYAGDCGADFDWDYVYDTLNGRDSIVFINKTPGVDDTNVIVIWSFGDGTIINGAAPEHSFDNDGDYTICMSILDMNTGCFDLICQTVQFRTTSVVAKTLQSIDFKAFPNPAQQVVNIALNELNAQEPVQFTISDLSGKIIATETYTGNSTFSFDTRSLSNGMYLLQVQQGGNTGFKRLSVVR